MTITVLPWRHASELAFVRDCFYPSRVPQSGSAVSDIYEVPTGVTEARQPPSSSALRAQDYEAGLRRVQIWNFRSPRSVPHAVTVTAGLIDAKLHDETGFIAVADNLRLDGDSGTRNVQDGFSISQLALKSIYAMAFLRFVNAFVDRDVSRAVHRTGLSKTPPTELAEANDDVAGQVLMVKGAGESSMYAHAASIGMPISFVDLRHRCVHGEVPDLPVLRRMSEKALGWLWERWWKGNSTGDSGRWKWEVQLEQDEGGMVNTAQDHDVNEDKAISPAQVEMDMKT